MTSNLQFVADGCSRARTAIETEVRRAVVLEFQERLKVGSLWRRWLVYRQINREVRRRLDARAPTDALY